MRLPSDWSAERRPGYGEVHHLTHEPCGWTSHNAYDLISTSGPFGQADARQVVYGHRCGEQD